MRADHSDARLASEQGHCECHICRKAAARLASEDVREQAREYLDLIRRSRLASRHAEADEYERNLLALFPPASSLGDAEGDTE